MPVTRDAEYPPTLSALFQAFNRCAEGYAISDVVDVAMNFTIAALGHAATAEKMTLDEREKYARQNADQIVRHVMSAVQRRAKTGDVSVPFSNA